MNEGKKDRRDPIRTIKAKNPVAKNASAAIGGGAAGAHKDKKKAMKQGDVKHKKAEYAESYEAHLTRRLNELSINTLKSYKDKRKVQQDAAKAAVPNPRTGDKDWIDQAVRGINMNTAQKKINRKEKEVAEAGVDPNAKNVPNVSVDLWKREYQKAVQAVNLAKTQQEYEAASERASKIKELLAGKGIKVGPVLGHEMAEAEGEPEGLPHLTKELAGHIAQQIETDGADAIVKSVTWGDGAADELVQFIKKALEKISSGGVDEATALAQHRERSAAADTALAARTKQSKDKPGSTLGKTLSDLEKRYPPAKEGWTHDSLADELFEHERTYEEQLAGKLAKQLKK